jgi:hypothetical protein
LRLASEQGVERACILAVTVCDKDMHDISDDGDCLGCCAHTRLLASVMQPRSAHPLLQI